VTGIAIALVTVLVLVWGRGSALPWSPACRAVDGAGAVLAEGTPAEMADLVADPSDELARAIGRGPAVTCRIGAPAATSTAKEPPEGLTPQARDLRREVRAQFGEVPDGGFGPEPVLPGRRAGGEHSLGRAVDFFFRPHEERSQQRAGWRLANWAVGNAERLGIRTVIYRDRIWTARRSIQGWRDYRFAGSDPDNPVNRHLDHVHIDVA